MENVIPRTSTRALVTLLSFGALAVYIVHEFDDVAAASRPGNSPSSNSLLSRDNVTHVGSESLSSEYDEFSADSRLSRALYEAELDLANTAATGPAALTFLDKDVASDPNITEAAALIGVDPAEWAASSWHSYSHFPWRLALGHAGETNATLLTEQNRTGLNPESLLREARRTRALKSYNWTFSITSPAEGGLAHSGDDSRGLAFAIYSELLHSYADVPSPKRKYLFVDGSNGWGNRNRVLTFAFTLAVATGRVLLLDSHKAEPFFPLVFRPPFSPWLTDEAHLTNIFHAKSARDYRSSVLDITANFRRKSKVLKCWEELHSLSKCGLSQSVPVLKVQGIYDLSPALAVDHKVMFGLNTRIRHACIRRVLRVAARGKGDAGGASGAEPGTASDSSSRGGNYSLELMHTAIHVCEAHTRYHWRSLVMSAMFGSWSDELVASVAAVKEESRWHEHKLIAAVHYRAFVDVYAGRNITSFKIPGQIWTCVARRILEAQELMFPGASAHRSASKTLIYVAADVPQIEEEAQAHVGHIGHVYRTPIPDQGTGIVHSNAFGKRNASNAVANAIAVMTEWELLSQAQLLFTYKPRSSHGGSTFSATAAEQSSRQIGVVATAALHPIAGTNRTMTWPLCSAFRGSR